MTIVVTGATGQLGRLIVDHLLQRGVAASDILAGGRNAARLEQLSGLGVRTAVLDYDDPDTVVAALAGVDTVMLVSASDPGDRLRQHRVVIDAASAAGVSRIVYTSAPHADTTDLVLAPEHLATEQALEASGIPTTILRNNWYHENYLGSLATARDTGAFSASTGEGRVASASRSDYAEAAAIVLTTDGHDGAVYELAGDDAWTGSELATAMSEVIGSPVEFRDLSADQQRAELTAAGLPEPTVGFIVALDQNIARGALADTDGTLARLIGHPTTPLVDGLRAGSILE